MKQIEIKIAEYDEAELHPDSYEYEEYDCSVEQTDENNDDSRSVITEIKPSVTQNSDDVFEGIFQFQGHWSVGSGEEDFLRFLPYMGMAAILVM